MEVLEPEVTKLMNFMYFQVKGIEDLLASLYAYSVCLILYARSLNLIVIFWGEKRSLRRAAFLMPVLTTSGVSRIRELQG